MAIHPIDFRYGTAEMRRIWSEEARFKAIIRAEVALAMAEAEVGLIPAEAAEAIALAAPKATLRRANEIESEIHHDMMAVVKTLAEVAGPAGRFVHFGATSNDILDTATGLQLKDAFNCIEEKLKILLRILIERSISTKTLVCAGRTHGQIGVPTTYGLRFAIWASEIGRHIIRLREISLVSSLAS